MNYELRNKILPVILYSVFIILILLRCQSRPRLELQSGQKIRVAGILAQEPQFSGNRQSFRIGRIQVITSRYPEYHYGDFLEITGEVEAVSAESHLAKLSYPKINSKSTTGIKGIKGIAIALSQKLKQFYNQTFPQPLDGIVAGVVLGDKSLIPLDFWEELQESGTLHIMVASGMNIAFFAGNALAILTLVFKRRLALGFLFILIWFYTLMTGLTPPVVRAAVMASLIYLAQFLGKPTQGGRVLFLSGAIMLFFEPFLIFDLGFQLSFLATAGLVFLQPIFQAQEFWLLRQENFASSLAAQITTLPILVLNFGQLNLISPLINLAVLWLIPFVLQLGVVIGLLGLLFGALGEIAAYLLYPALFLIEQIVSQTARFRIFQVQFPFFSFWLGVVYYLVLMFWLTRSKTRKSAYA